MNVNRIMCTSIYYTGDRSHYPYQVRSFKLLSLEIRVITSFVSNWGFSISWGNDVLVRFTEEGVNNAIGASSSLSSGVLEHSIWRM